MQPHTFVSGCQTYELMRRFEAELFGDSIHRFLLCCGCDNGSVFSVFRDFASRKTETFQQIARPLFARPRRCFLAVHLRDSALDITLQHNKFNVAVIVRDFFFRSHMKYVAMTITQKRDFLGRILPPVESLEPRRHKYFYFHRAILCGRLLRMNRAASQLVRHGRR